MVKSCNPKIAKATNPLYECNPKTGRYVKKPDKRLECLRRFHDDLGITIKKSHHKFVYLPQDLLEKQMKPERIKHELVHYQQCYLHFSWIPLKDLTVKNPLWKNVASYRDLVRVTLRFLELLPPLYRVPLPPKQKDFTHAQKLDHFHARDQNLHLLKAIHQVLVSFVETYERLTRTISARPFPTNAQKHALVQQLKERGVLPYRSFTMDDEGKLVFTKGKGKSKGMPMESVLEAILLNMGQQQG